MNDILDKQVTKSASVRYAAFEEENCENLASVQSLQEAAIFDNSDEAPRYVNRLIQLGRHDLAADFLEEQSRGEINFQSVLERVIEQNNLMSVAFFPKGVSAARTVCRVVIRDQSGRLRGFGSGFMISPCLMMTNNHVLTNPSIAAKSVAEFDYAFGVDGNALPTKSFNLNPVRFFETHHRDELDFTIVAVEEINKQGDRLEDRGWINLVPKSGKAVAGEPLNIIQHPAGEHMQIAIRENKTVKAKGDYFIYTTDTKRGSSGSPVLNDQWQVAALHHAGVARMDQNGAWLRKDGGIFREGIDDPATIDWIANEGIRISRIVANMRSRNLSGVDKALFEESISRPSPINIQTELSSPTAQPAPSDPLSNSPVIGSDGIAKWNFQLSFGPLGTPPGAPSPSAQVVTSTTPLMDAEVPLADSSRIESVFEPRGNYYDSCADELAATAYYKDIDDVFEDLTKAVRYDEINKMVSNTHQTKLSYKSARHDHLYPWIDRHESQVLQSIYSGTEMSEELFLAEIENLNAAIDTAAEALGTESSSLSEAEIERIDLTLEAASQFNCEHVVPQSWFKGDAEEKAQKTDLHHLFTCEGGCNSFRSNIPFWDFDPADENRLQAAEISPSESLSDSTLEGARPLCGLREKRRFEPHAGKGAVARATLYFVLRYPGSVGNVKTGSKKEFVKSNVNILVEWATQEPPSIYELHRNAEIHKVQGNRNPLIDRPEWITEIDFGRGFG